MRNLKKTLKPRLCASEYAKSFFANFKMKIDTDNTGSYPPHRANEYARGSIANCRVKTNERIYGG
jgi:hypothetical protein